jgi:hypothetical protein
VAAGGQAVEVTGGFFTIKTPGILQDTGYPLGDTKNKKALSEKLGAIVVVRAIGSSSLTLCKVFILTGDTRWHEACVKKQQQLWNNYGCRCVAKPDRFGWAAHSETTAQTHLAQIAMEVPMHPRYYPALATCIILLSACGRSDTTTPGVSAPIQQAGSHMIADLLSTPSAPGQSVEIDAYHWVGWMRGNVGYALDAQGCPALFDVTYLTDRPVPEAIDFPFFSRTNLSPSYPAKEDVWLIPMPSVITPVPATPVPDVATGAITPTTLPPHVVGSLNIPYRARLRGHLGDPAFAKCAHSDRIFVVEGITTAYEDVPQNSPIDEPEGYRSWPQYHDSAFGYSFAYAPNWRVKALKEADTRSAVMVHTTAASDFPISIRIHSGETQIDRTDVSSLPPLYRRRSSDDVFGNFNQGGIFVGGKSNGQNLAGLWVDRPDGSNTRTMTVLISAHGYTYEIVMVYPIGLRANRSLLDAYALVLDRFLLDIPQEPSPTPAFKQVVGPGPFLTQDQITAAAHKKYAEEFEVVEARLVPEVELRKLVDECGTFRGHPDGVWLLRISGTYEGQDMVALMGFDATNGEQLCGTITKIGSPPPIETVGPAYPQPTPASP